MNTFFRISDNLDSCTKTERRAEIWVWFSLIQCNPVSLHSVTQAYLTPCFITYILERSELFGLGRFNFFVSQQNVPRYQTRGQWRADSEAWVQFPWLWRGTPSVQEWYLCKQGDILIWKLCECVKVLSSPGFSNVPLSQLRNLSIPSKIKCGPCLQFNQRKYKLY